MMFFAAISPNTATRRRSSAAPLQSFPFFNSPLSIVNFQFSIVSRLYSHFPLSLFIVIHLMLRTFCQFYHFANVSKMVGICQLSNGKRTNELKYCFNNHSWALSLIMA